MFVPKEPLGSGCYPPSFGIVIQTSFFWNWLSSFCIATIHLSYVRTSLIDVGITCDIMILMELSLNLVYIMSLSQNMTKWEHPNSKDITSLKQNKISSNKVKYEKCKWLYKNMPHIYIFFLWMMWGLPLVAQVEVTLVEEH